MFFSALILLVTVVLFLIYINGKYNANYWRKRGVVYDTNNKYIGPFFEYIYSKQSVYEIFQRIYNSHPGAPGIGLPSFFAPTLLVPDLTNIQHLLASDFYSFNHRGFEPNEDDLLADNILFMSGKRWKLMRQHMTPLFTSTKLKNMFYILDKSATDFMEYLKNNPQYLKGNAFKTLSTFCSAAIGAAVFGVSTESVFESPFLEMAQKANATTFKTQIGFAVSSVSPKIFKFLGIKIFKDYEDFFIGAIKQIIRAREQDKVKRYDFADICVSLQQNGTLRDSETGLELEPTDEILAAQAFFFFIAGVEPCASGMFSTLVELGRHPEILKKVHDEVDRAFANHKQISYEVLSELEYLDEVISEAMRLHPPISNVSRQCVNNTTLPVGNIKVDKGTRLFVPIYQIHYDAKYYPDPEQFKPERFSKENRQNIIDAAYMPFGKGNRICVGTRFASIQMKAGLVHLLRNYTVRTILKGDKIKYKRDILQLRIANADVEFIPRY